MLYYKVRSKMDRLHSQKFLKKMTWIVESNCTISCPTDTLCFRPLEFSEPELCVHDTITNFPENLLHPVLSYDFLLTVLILIIVIVNFLLVVCTIISQILKYSRSK